MSSCNIASLPYRVWPQGIYGDRQISVVNPFWVSFLRVDQIEASTSSPGQTLRQLNFWRLVWANSLPLPIWRQANLNCSPVLSWPSSTSSPGQTLGHSRFWWLVCSYLSTPPPPSRGKKLLKCPTQLFRRRQNRRPWLSTRRLNRCLTLRFKFPTPARQRFKFPSPWAQTMVKCQWLSPEILGWEIVFNCF